MVFNSGKHEQSWGGSPLDDGNVSESNNSACTSMIHFLSCSLCMLFKSEAFSVRSVMLQVTIQFKRCISLSHTLGDRHAHKYTHLDMSWSGKPSTSEGSKCQEHPSSVSLIEEIPPGLLHQSTTTE